MVHHIQQQISEKQVEALDDQELTERAKAGDTEAFGELVRRHRTSAANWARSMAKDTHTAEDIVQDALIKAFLHVGQLVDSSRFIGWLQAIVRNQANMRLRRGGQYRYEQPFTSLAKEDLDSPQVNWSDVDSILYYLSNQLADKQVEYNPEALYLRKETIDMIHTFLHCLNHKERRIFEAYFFKQWTPAEIASMFQTTTQSVYTYIYRAKRKVRNEYSRMIHTSSNKMVQEGGVQMKKLGLPPKKAPATAFTFIDSIYKMLQMKHEPCSIDELMGRSGVAFRLRISGMATYADGAFIFDWQKGLQKLFHDYGYDTHFLTGQLPEDTVIPLVPVASAFPMTRSDPEVIVTFVKRFIDANNPVLFFDTYVQKPYTYEWSIIWGYNDELKVVYVTDPMTPFVKTLSYEDVASSGLRFLCAITKRKEDKLQNESTHDLPYLTELQEILRIGLEGDGYKPNTPFPFYVQGLQAYDAWIEHLSSGPQKVSSYGMGYLARVYADCRMHAAHYMEQLSRKINPAEDHKKLTAYFQAAQNRYEQTSREFTNVGRLFPFLSGQGSYDEETLQQAQECLIKAKATEKEALHHIHEAILYLTEGEK